MTLFFSILLEDLSVTGLVNTAEIVVWLMSPSEVSSPMVQNSDTSHKPVTLGRGLTLYGNR